MNKSKLKSQRINRRSFVKLLPAAGAAGLAISKSPLKALAQTLTPSPSPRPTPAPRITRDMMHNAEKLIGIELTDKQLFKRIQTPTIPTIPPVDSTSRFSAVH